MDFLTLDNALTALHIVTGLVTGASVILLAIAPHTSTDLDDRAVGFLAKVKSVLEKIALNVK
jgi:hypothetical protein